jgi:hypothetical protein
VGAIVAAAWSRFFEAFGERTLADLDAATAAEPAP